MATTVDFMVSRISLIASLLNITKITKKLKTIEVNLSPEQETIPFPILKSVWTVPLRRKLWIVPLRRLTCSVRRTSCRSINEPLQILTRSGVPPRGRSYRGTEGELGNSGENLSYFKMKSILRTNRGANPLICSVSPPPPDICIRLCRTPSPY